MRHYQFVIYLLSLISIISSCDSDERGTIIGDDIQNSLQEGVGCAGFDFYMIDSQGGVFFPFLINDSAAHIYIGKNADYKSIRPVAKYNNANVDPDSLLQDSVDSKIYLDFSDYVHPVRACYSLPEGKKRFSIILYDLPVLIIDAPDNKPIISKTERVDGCVVSIVSDGGFDTIGIAGIKSRGHSTWQQPKKPYNIKFESKQRLLGMSKSKHWILLANAYYDRTQLHNATAFEMARMTDFPWVQSGKFVELILNGEYRGLYYLCEKIGVGEDKINIVKMKQSDVEGDNLTGGYLLETKQPDDTDWFFQTDYFTLTQTDFGAPLCWTLKCPDQDDGIDSLQLEYIRSCMNKMESLIWNVDSLKIGKYRDLFDIETAINWLLVEEAALNGEASGSKNIFMYKNRGEDKFYIGPPWDFDAWSFGSRFVDSFWASRSGLYYYQLLKDPFFVKRLKEKWSIYKKMWEDSIPIFIEDQAAYIRNAALRNEKMWKKWSPLILNRKKSWDETIEDMRVSFLRQLEWIDNQYESGYPN